MSDSTSVDSDDEKKQENEFFKKTKNIKINELIHGKTPNDIDEQCFKLAKIYMCNNNQWKKFCKSKNDLIIQRITGGLTNQLYYVGLKNNDNEIINEITIKLYQSKYLKKDSDNEDDRINDIIISIIVGEKGLGPKVFGIFPNGIIQSYHEHEQFRPKQQHDDRLLQKLAHLLAYFNYLIIPIAKDKFYVLDIIRDYIHEGYDRLNISALAKELHLKYLLENDFLVEMDWFDSFIRKFDNECPMVFNHNDFRGNNIMVGKGNQEIIFCDFEFSAYGFRGYDIATFLMEWDRDYFNFDDTSLPSDEIVEKFLKFYLEGWDKIVTGYSQREENSLKKLMFETKIAHLFVHVNVMAITMHQKEGVVENFLFDPKQIAIGVNFMFKRYLDLKESLSLKNYY